jgi:hypothetical protein
MIIGQEGTNNVSCDGLAVLLCSCLLAARRESIAGIAFSVSCSHARLASFVCTASQGEVEKRGNDNRCYIVPD